MLASAQLSTGVKRLGLVIGLCVAVGWGGTAAAAADGRAEATSTGAMPTLLDLWFTLQASGPIYAPYAYIRHRDTQAKQAARKRTLLEEIGNLTWRLEAAGSSALADAMGQWQRHLRAADTYRTPGHWGPAALLSGARNGVPVTAIAAVGACQVPTWVEVWSAQGVQRVRWQPGMHLSALLDEDSVLADTVAQHVTVVMPYGNTAEYGIAAWNFENPPLLPGMRVIVPLPLGGQAATWLQSELSEFLAHLVPADQCRQIKLKHETADEAS